MEYEERNIELVDRLYADLDNASTCAEVDTLLEAFIEVVSEEDKPGTAYTVDNRWGEFHAGCPRDIGRTGKERDRGPVESEPRKARLHACDSMFALRMDWENLGH